jgi:hypothetical protein
MATVCLINTMPTEIMNLILHNVHCRHSKMLGLTCRYFKCFIDRNQMGPPSYKFSDDDLEDFFTECPSISLLKICIRHTKCLHMQRIAQLLLVTVPNCLDRLTVTLIKKMSRRHSFGYIRTIKARLIDRIPFFEWNNTIYYRGAVGRIRTYINFDEYKYFMATTLLNAARLDIMNILINPSVIMNEHELYEYMKKQKKFAVRSK